MDTGETDDATRDRVTSDLTCRLPIPGGTLEVRPILPCDAARLRQFHERLSPRSVYLRYFYLHPHLLDDEIRRFTHVDYVNRLALVGLLRDRIVAVGRYERLPEGDEAEVAFVVADEFHCLGIGSGLLALLAEAALGNGITTLVAETLAENRNMIDVFMNSSFRVTTSRAGETVQFRLDIGAVAQETQPRKAL